MPRAGQQQAHPLRGQRGARVMADAATLARIETIARGRLRYG